MNRRRQFEYSMRRFAPEFFEQYGKEKGLWYESPEEARREAAHQRRRRRLLRWVREEMEERLSECERKYIRLYYFGGQTHQQIASQLAVHPSTVLRGIRRGIKKLRRAAIVAGLAQVAAARAIRPVSARKTSR